MRPLGKRAIEPGRHSRLILLVLGIALAACALALPVSERVVLRNKQGQLLFQARAPRGGERVWLLYTHSVNKTLVEDGFVVEGGDMLLECSRYRSYGAGIAEPEPGQKLVQGEDYLELQDINRRIPVVWTYVGRVADHRLRLGEAGEVIHLNQLAQPGTLVGLSAERWSLARILWEKGDGL